MFKRSILTIVCLCIVSVGFAEDGVEWFRSVANVPDKGTTEWTVVMTTGHFGLDPQLAQASRDLVIEMLNSVGSKQDSVRVFSSELTIWDQSGKLPLDGIASALPSTSASDSKGGRDIETAISVAAQTANGSVLLVSPGESQLASDGSGKLRGGPIKVEGFELPQKSRIAVTTPSGQRQLLLIFLRKKQAFTGDAIRTPLAPIATSKNDVQPSVKSKAHAKDNLGESEATSSSGIGSIIGASLLSIILFSAGIFVGKKLFSESQKLPLHSPDELTTSPTETDEDLEQWKQSAKALQRKLDLIAQDLAESASLTTQAEDIRIVELRQEIARNNKSLQTWDETAIDYLDGISRALENVSLSDAEKQIWVTSEKHFLRLIQRSGLDIIAPEIGSEVLDNLHRIEETVEPTTVFTSGLITTLISPGFRRGDQIIRQAKVIIAS